MSARALDVEAVRLERWIDGFGARHGGVVSCALDERGAEFVAADGSTAGVDAPFPVTAKAHEAAPATSADLDALLAAARQTGPVAVLLARRGGYACAVVDGDTVRASKTGTRYVQSRTAAGGWSQQRYARRRANQADGLVEALIEHTLRLVVPAGPGRLVTGGDRHLVDQALGDSRLRVLVALPRGRHLTVGDPSGRLVADLPHLLRTFRIRLSEAESQ